MTTADAKRSQPSATTGDDRHLGVLLACFAEPKAAGKAHGPLENAVRSAGDSILDTTVVKVNAKHKALVYDPRRILISAATPALTWGLCGLLFGGWQSGIIWAVLGALCGWPYAYYVHHASKAELKHIGRRLPAKSSALLMFAETSDARRLLDAAAAHAPSVASAAAIGDDLSVRVFAGANHPVEVPHGSRTQELPVDQTSAFSMIALRYPERDGANQAAARLANKPKASDAAYVEVVIDTDRDGHRHVKDPKQGPAAWIKGDIIGWGAFGLLCGVISGATTDSGLAGVIKQGVGAAIVLGAFGIFAGFLYGTWVGRSISARRLKRVGPLLAPDTSLLVAWADGSVSAQTIDTLNAPQAQRLVLLFNPTERGAVLEAT
jgi:hypothetical protein